jgi:predicted MFS family arabinose efflux permease
MAMIGILCGGATTAATFPYLPILAVEELALDPTIFSIIIFLEGVLAVGVAIAVGYYSDRMDSRKPLMIAAVLSVTIGYLLLPILAPIMTFMLHAVFGAVLGAVYQAQPGSAPQVSTP